MLNKNLNFFPAAFMALFLAGCGSSLVIHTMTVGRQTRTRLAGDTTLINPDNIIDMSTSLDLERLVDAENKTSFFLQVSYVNDHLIEILPGSSLVLLLDNKDRLVFKGKGSGDYRKPLAEDSQGMMIERASYPIDKPTMARLAEARSVKVELTGKKQTLHLEMGPDTLEKYRAFIRSYQ